MSTSPINDSVSESCSNLWLYRGPMTLLPHQGSPRPGEGTINLLCGAVQRHLRVTFELATSDRDGGPKLPGSPDGRFGPGTTFIKTPGTLPFFVFVTSGGSTVVGESHEICGDPDIDCDTLDLYLLNCLLPAEDTTWETTDCQIAFERTTCAYNLTRLSLPVHEINLTHRLRITSRSGTSINWRRARGEVHALLQFLGFTNNEKIHAPVVFGRRAGTIAFYRFSAPDRTAPENRRTWATQLSATALDDAFAAFKAANEDSFWSTVFQRAIDWLSLAALSRHDSTTQALVTTQLILEMLAYAILVEDAAILGEDGYGKLPAADRITLLSGYIGQPVSLPFSDPELLRFCASSNIHNVGGLIAGIRNKFVHPTKKNREYLSTVPPALQSVATQIGIQLASLAILRGMNYRGVYFDTLSHALKPVPWALERSKPMNGGQSK